MNDIKIEELKHAIHAIVIIKGRIPIPRDIFYQVTIDPLKLSPSKINIRLGDVKGDEFTGWVQVSDVVIMEVLGEFSDSERVPYNDGQAWNPQ